MMDATEMKIAKRIRDRLDLPTGVTTQAILRRLIDRGIVTNTPETTPALRLTDAGCDLLMSGPTAIR